jgi:DNA polymerase-3 subunit delta
MTYDDILSSLKKGEFQPVYFFHGDEPYFIDTLSRYIEEHALEEDQRSFNQTVLYGKDTDARTVIDVASRYPMMAPRQVVIVKEAQELRDLQDLKTYVEKPVASTVLVFCHKHKKFDKRKALAKSLKGSGAIVFESKRVYDNQVGGWIRQFLKARGVSIDDQASELMGEYLGTDLSKVANELEKLLLNVGKGECVTIDLVHEHIGISKDYNVFELQRALAGRDIPAVNRIVTYLSANTKTNPMVYLVGSLYTYFSKVALMQELRTLSERELLSAMKLSSAFFLREYRQAAANYPPLKLRHIFHLLKEYDMRSKGLNNDRFEEGELLRELVFRIVSEAPPQN